MGRRTMIASGLAGAAATLAMAGAVSGQAGPGKAIFEGKGNCFACHGPTAKGTPLAPDLTDNSWVNFDARPSTAEVEGLVKKGVPKPVEHPAPMPPMGGGSMSAEEVGQVAAYVLSLSAPEGAAAGAAKPAGTNGAARAARVERPAAPAALPQETRAVLPSLFALMQGLQTDMARIGRGLWLESYDSIAVAARAVAEHPTIAPEEAQKIAGVLGADMARFKAFDTTVHDLAMQMAEDAERQDLDAVLAGEAKLRQGCVACHTTFRGRLREGLGAG